MKILAIEASAVAASAAVCEDERILAQSFQNNGLTHSVTLLPMVERLLCDCGMALDAVDLIAVAAGPGSFTGLRIGIATAKGLAWPGDKPCAGVSTLEAMAWSVAHMGGELCPVMDARRNQVYNARFRAVDGRPVRLTEDRAIGVEELAGELKKSGKPQILVGDGAELCYNSLSVQKLDLRMAPEHLRFQSAWGVARAGLEMAREGALTNAAGLIPKYHRLSQAERERLEKADPTAGKPQS